ncbi:MAG: hypothetical protein ACOCQX_00955 [Candidatus Nanoarchaeia archaeon]
MENYMDVQGKNVNMYGHRLNLLREGLIELDKIKSYNNSEKEETGEYLRGEIDKIASLYKESKKKLDDFIIFMQHSNFRDNLAETIEETLKENEINIEQHFNNENDTDKSIYDFLEKNREDIVGTAKNGANWLEPAVDQNYFEVIDDDVYFGGFHIGSIGARIKHRIKGAPCGIDSLPDAGTYFEPGEYPDGKVPISLETLEYELKN